MRETHTVSVDHAGKRLDKVLVLLWPEHSRSQLQTWLREGHIHVDGHILSAKTRLQGGEQISADLPDIERNTPFTPQNIPLDILFADEHVIFVNKPAGLVVHPAAGNWDGTLLNGLLFHFPEVSDLPRAGIVHRLDKETSGILVVARTTLAYDSLVEQLQQRQMTRLYDAVAVGQFVAGGKVNEPIDRHPKDRKRMAVRPQGKPAVTHYRVLEKYRVHTYLRVKLETGRTHQIRVHLSHLRKPLIGDPVYGGRVKLPEGCSTETRDVIQGFQRQALHARRLTIVHPSTGKSMTWSAPLPDDLQQLINTLRLDAGLEIPAEDIDPDVSQTAADAIDADAIDDDWDDWNEDDYDVDFEYV